MKKALITGTTGQDGSYLVELLLSKGYEVHGLKRRASSFNTERIDHIFEDPQFGNQRFFLHYGDMTDSTCLIKLVADIQPDEIYNLAAQSHVKVSFEIPEYTANADAVGTLRLLEAIRINRLENKTKFYQASTSEMYGGVGFNMPENGYTEQSPFYPRSPYGAAKMYGYWITINYRESYNMFACNGILFNHESPRRGETFVTRKITMGLAKISLGLQDCLYLGNLDAKRDRGHAKDYVEGMRMMLQHNTPEDFVLATGITTKVRDFIELSSKFVNIDIERQGQGEKEIGIDKKTGKTIIKVDPKYYRPAEVDLLLGDPTKAKNTLGRQPKYNLEMLAEEMMQSDLEKFKR